jgi:hypothetical protein
MHPLARAAEALALLTHFAASSWAPANRRASRRVLLGENVDADRPSRPGLLTEAKQGEHMPTCGSSCHPAAIIVAHTGSAVGHLGFAGVLSTAAASMLGIGYKRGPSDAPAAASDADANQTPVPGAVPGSASSPDAPPYFTR